jgi:hypothetical protein
MGSGQLPDCHQEGLVLHQVKLEIITSNSHYCSISYKVELLAGGLRQLVVMTKYVIDMSHHKILLGSVEGLNIKL